MKFSKKTTILILLSIYSVFMGYLLFNFITINKAINATNAIRYKVLENKTSYWRGTSYRISIEYDSEIYNTSISRAMYDSIELGLKPILYYNQDLDSIANNYEKSLVFKLMLVVSLLAIVLSISVYFYKKN